MFRVEFARLNEPFLRFRKIAGVKRDISQAQIRQNLFAAHFDYFAVTALASGR